MTSPSRLSRTTTCGSLLQELQKIWDEIGESDSERDKMLLQLEQECLDIYRRKVEKTRKHKADLHQAIAEAEAEIAILMSALGERTSFSRSKGSLKEQLSAIKPVLEDLRLKKEDRIKALSEIQAQIVWITTEIAGNIPSFTSDDAGINERDLTVKKLGELKSHLEELQTEKILRLQKVNNHLNSIRELSIVLSHDTNKTLAEVHPSLTDPANGQTKSISNDTLARLTDVVNSLNQEKQQRLQKLQELGRTLLDLWNLMETPADERKRFDHIAWLISSSVDEISMQGCLALDVIEMTEAEVERLKVLKSSKMKELVLKRQNELEEIYNGVHMDVDSVTARKILTNIINTGDVDLSDLLIGMDNEIAKAKEMALSRKDILDKVDKWKHASEEENWLDDYERDENRYSAGRGAHKNLKRAEKARILVSKIPSLVENLNAKVKAWESEKGIPFLYDKAALLHILEEYTKQRQEREEEKRRSREQKRLQEQLATEKEVLFGSRSAIKKPLGQSANANNIVGTPGRRVLTPARQGISVGKDRKEGGKGNVAATIPLNYVALPKDDSVPRSS